MGEIRVYRYSFFNVLCRRWSSGQFHLRILDVRLFVFNISRTFDVQVAVRRDKFL